MNPFYSQLFLSLIFFFDKFSSYFLKFSFSSDSLRLKIVLEKKISENSEQRQFFPLEFSKKTILKEYSPLPPISFFSQKFFHHFYNFNLPLIFNFSTITYSLFSKKNYKYKFQLTNALLNAPPPTPPIRPTKHRTS